MWLDDFSIDINLSGGKVILLIFLNEIGNLSIYVMNKYIMVLNNVLSRVYKMP